MTREELRVRIETAVSAMPEYAFDTEGTIEFIVDSKKRITKINHPGIISTGFLITWNDKSTDTVQQGIDLVIRRPRYAKQIKSVTFNGVEADVTDQDRTFAGNNIVVNVPLVKSGQDGPIDHNTV